METFLLSIIYIYIYIYGTSCKIDIHFWFKITQYLINGIRLLFQICPRHSFPYARHRHKVSNSFTKESGRDK